MMKIIAAVGVLLLGIPVQAALEVWTEHSTVKIREDAKPQASTALREITINAARREVGAFQIALRSEVAAKDVSIRIEGLDHVSLWREHFIDTSQGRFPDGLTPLKPLDLEPNLTQPIFVEIDVPPDTKAGKRAAQILVSVAKDVVQTIPLTLNVRDFELPAAPSLRSAFGNYDDPIAAFEGVAKSDPNFPRLRKEYYEILLDHRISPYTIPESLNDPASDAYLNDPRLTSYTIPYLEDDAQLDALVKRLRAGGRFAKGYFYPVDEPSTEDAYKRLDQVAARLKRIVGPDYKLISPYCANPQFKTDKDLYDYLTGRVTIWCYLTSIHSFHPEKLEARRAAGEEIWNYVAWVPLAPYANLQIQQPAIANRILFWQEWKYRAAGVLYWGTNFWSNDAGGTTDPWKDMATVKWASKEVFGDGSLLYPGKPVGERGPMPSLRLKLIRQGMQDYDYIKLAADRVGREKVDEIVNGEVKDWKVYQQDPAKLDEAKAQLVKMIEAK